MTAWMTTAWSLEGVREVPGPDADPRILTMFAAVGHPEIRDDVVSWCAAGVGYCLTTSGIALTAIPHEQRLRARAYLAFGTPIDTPRPGAIAVFERPDGGPDAGHVGFVVGHDDTHIHVLGFNQSDTVNVQRFPRARLLGLRWPVVDTAAVATSSRIIKGADASVLDAKKIAAVPLVGEVVTRAPLPDLNAVAAKAGALQSTVETLLGFAGFLGKRWPLIAAGLCLWWALKIAVAQVAIRTARQEDAATGKTT
jgi:uncharacterized protein (TIGR02594 family)